MKSHLQLAYVLSAWETYIMSPFMQSWFTTNDDNDVNNIVTLIMTMDIYNGSNGNGKKIEMVYQSVTTGNECQHW